MAMKGAVELLHLEEALPGQRTPSSEGPIHSIRDFPKLQTQYAAALQKTSPEDDRRRFDKMTRNGSKASLAPSLPEGWNSYIHPKGWIYYYHPAKRIVTDYKIEYPLGLQEFEQAMREVKGFPVERLPQSSELWVDYRLEAGKNIAEKLFVDHSKRRLTPQAPKHRSGSLCDDGTWQDSDIDVREQLKLEQAYWDYIINHPCHASLPESAEEDAIAALTWFAQDRLINPEESITPYSKDQCKDLLDLLCQISDRKDTFGTTRNGYIKTHFIANILERIAGERLSQHYGQQDARVYLKRTLKMRRDEIQDVSLHPVDLLLNFIMAFICFGTPYSYLKHINEFFINGPGRTDTIVERWSVFVEENVNDWTNTNLVATVLVSASVAFLAVPGIDDKTRILGIVSTLFSIASIIVGLLNVWQHQHKSRASLEITVIFDFFAKAEKLVKTDKLLAILLSLPMVLLIWATLFFAASVVTYSWLGINEDILTAQGPDKSSIQLIDARFDNVVGWVASGTLILLICVVLTSFFYFWRAWKPSSFRSIIKRKRKEKERKRFLNF